MQDPTRREQVIAGLRELAQFLQDHPDLPVPAYSGATMSVHVRHDGGIDPGDETAAVARVHEIAAILGAEVRESVTCSAVRTFSGGTEYEVCHVPARSRVAWRALTSYDDNFQVTS